MSGISSVLCGVYWNYAEDANFRELCGSTSPNPVRCPVIICLVGFSVLPDFRLQICLLSGIRTVSMVGSVEDKDAKLITNHLCAPHYLSCYYLYFHCFLPLIPCIHQDSESKER